MNAEKEFFALNEVIGESIECPREECGGVENTASERDEALFAKVKADMVRRIFGNAPAKARNEAAMPPTTND